MGLERIVALLEQQSLAPTRRRARTPTWSRWGGRRSARRTASRRRCANHVESLSLTVDAAGGSFRTKLKRADRSGARYALILGDAEVRDARVGVKALRDESEQRSMRQSALAEFLRA